MAGKLRMQDFVAAHTDSGTVGTVSVSGGDKGKGKGKKGKKRLGESWI